MGARNKCCGFIGDNKLTDLIDKETFSKMLSDCIESVIKKGVDTFYCGVTPEFDMMCAQLILEKKKEQSLKLIIVLPYVYNSSLWEEENAKRFNYILANADEKNVIAERYFYGCMERKTAFVVDKCKYMIRYQSDINGGEPFIDHDIVLKIEI